ncbi:MAG TPA: CRISPR-associated endonuclease Cas2 [Polyangiaceae bacterium LLY-WYZ-15_(1-7)]|nr:CRISPR-associated endonuclease Cas2 [Polyangiaceae bacterium LLY-WYZ-15_(1-7)]HJL00258.1 CRISPR-associated endonuclease Cas2 [Polyangiaceae bacterium LLY-WYZ-15_(1-7)]HJL08273.1 CRISPR-associated endonuclease Cas2 [Polyangiaceae bacterium LLY-WYZ-15_(1-7)]HJL25242.1 CRISPR-associated endonuclease Cas2 [Polyangiaceae bacterium LLY-WYZ-15_(1-7)]
MHTLISFDITDDRSRYRVAKRLLDDARRVQKSVFEATVLRRAAYLRLRSDLEGRIDPETDSLRYYRLCGACARRIEHVGAGVGLLEVPPAFEIIDGE